MLNELLVGSAYRTDVALQIIKPHGVHNVMAVPPRRFFANLGAR